MLALLRLPLELLYIAFCFLRAIADSLRGCRRRRFESRVLVNAPREAVWRFINADRVVFDGPPVLEMADEPLPDSAGLTLTRTWLSGREIQRVVSRRLKLDEAEGTFLCEVVPHELSLPPHVGTDYYAGLDIKDAPGGTLLTLLLEVTVGSFGQRIKLPIAVRQQAARIKRQCEKEAGTQSQLAALANKWLVLSLLALLSFWYLVGWQDALLLAVIIVLHELGHAAAMRMVGIPVQGIYLIPFFGGAAVPKTAYRSQGQLGFVALMGPGFSLLPTLALALLYYRTGDAWVLHAAFLFAIVNGSNLLPIYPLDGGLILNALLGSLSGRLASAARWLGVLTGLGAAVYLQSLLLGIPFLLFALQLYLGGGRTGEIKRLSAFGGTTLVAAFGATVAVYVATFSYATNERSILDEEREERYADAVEAQRRRGIPMRCDLPASSAEVLDRLLSERSEIGDLQLTDGTSLIRILAWADRAGHGDKVRGWLEAPLGFGLPPDMIRIGQWHALAKSGSLAAIEHEIATFRAPTAYDPTRDILTVALVVHGRTQDAVALLPSTDPWKRQIWLGRTLTDLLSAGAVSEVVTLLERTHTDALAMEYSHHLVALASMLQRMPAAALGDKSAVVDVLTQQLRSGLKAHRSSSLPACRPGGSLKCTDEDRKAFLQHLQVLEVRVSEIEALAKFGHTDVDLPDDAVSHPHRWGYVLPIVAAALAETDDEARAEALRSLFLKPPPGAADGPSRQAVANDAFEIEYAAARIALSLRRGDVERALALAEAAGRGDAPLRIRPLMIDHYLQAGDWGRAEAWAKRGVVLGPVTEADGEPRPPEARLATRDLQRALDLAYEMKLAAMAAEKGEATLANAALERARPLACEQSRSSVYMRHEWSTFLRRAYLLKAFQEGRLPAHALERPS